MWLEAPTLSTSKTAKLTKAAAALVPARKWASLQAWIPYDGCEDESPQKFAQMCERLQRVAAGPPSPQEDVAASPKVLLEDVDFEGTNFAKLASTTQGRKDARSLLGIVDALCASARLSATSMRAFAQFAAPFPGTVEAFADAAGGRVSRRADASPREVVVEDAEDAARRVLSRQAALPSGLLGPVPTFTAVVMVRGRGDALYCEACARHPDAVVLAVLHCAADLPPSVWALLPKKLAFKA